MDVTSPAARRPYALRRSSATFRPGSTRLSVPTAGMYGDSAHALPAAIAHAADARSQPTCPRGGATCSADLGRRRFRRPRHRVQLAEYVGRVLWLPVAATGRAIPASANHAAPVPGSESARGPTGS